MAGDPWAFGWTQLLTILGLLLTTGIAVSGFRSFGRWKREKVEERRIETALDALTLAYESRDVFNYIRGAISYSFDYADMPETPGDTEEARNLRGSYFVVGKRVVEHRDFFDRAWKMQPRVMAVFGEEVEAIFKRLHNARATVQVASKTLAFEMPLNPIRESLDDHNLRVQMRNDLWGSADGTDRVETDLKAFCDGIVRLCRPVVDHEFRSDGKASR
jgi:hypothetical protein